MLNGVSKRNLMKLTYQVLQVFQAKNTHVSGKLLVPKNIKKIQPYPLKIPYHTATERVPVMTVKRTNPFQLIN